MDTAAGLAGATQNVYNGTAGIGDALAFAPALGYLAGKLGQRVGLLATNCFAAGTAVAVGAVGESGSAGVFSEKRIEDVQIGDLVWSRDEGDPDAAVELKPVTALYRHTAYDLQDLDLSDGSGNVESLVVTDEHPFYVEGRGWTTADQLAVGERVLGGAGAFLTVSGNADDYRQDGITVYNFEVGGDHTYFVADGAGEESWAWAHNDCTSKAAKELRVSLLAANKNEAKYAAHIIPTNGFSKRSHDVVLAIQQSQEKFDQLVGAANRNGALNGFFTSSRRHLGTHTNKFFRDMGLLMSKAETAEDVTNALNLLRNRALKGTYK